MAEESFSTEKARTAYEGFPADLSVDEWRKRLQELVKTVDHFLQTDYLQEPDWVISATARKARDVVLYTLEDARIPRLLAALVQAMPVLSALRQKAQENIQNGVQIEDNLRVNKWMKDLFDAVKAMQN